MCDGAVKSCWLCWSLRISALQMDTREPMVVWAVQSRSYLAAPTRRWGYRNLFLLDYFEFWNPTKQDTLLIFKMEKVTVVRQVVRYNLNILQLSGGWNVGILRDIMNWKCTHHSKSLSICPGIIRGLKMTKTDLGACFPIICKLSLYWCRELWQWGQILVLSTLLVSALPSTQPML